MATHNRTLQLLAAKLGLSNEEKVIRKAAELERLLQTKSTTGSNMTDTGKIVICLDLAATFYNTELDLKAAIKYSGLKPQMYANCKKTVENLLEINNNILTTSLLCAALQCSSIQKLADEILVEYEKHAKIDIDAALPQYVCMAVYQACRINKVKVSKTKLIQKSRLKSGQWLKLEADWTKFVDAQFATVNKKKGGRETKTNGHDENTSPMDVEIEKKIDTTEWEIESYKDWKKRILNAAYMELKLMEEKRNQQSPRKFSRKTPQKYTPYPSTTSPSKDKGIQLVFAVPYANK